MNLHHDHITLVYATPKYVNTKIRSVCGCGTKYTTVKCERYARIHVGCTTCGQAETIHINRKVIVHHMMAKFAWAQGGLPHFLDSWEKTMYDNK